MNLIKIIKAALREIKPIKNKHFDNKNNEPHSLNKFPTKGRIDVTKMVSDTRLSILIKNGLNTHSLRYMSGKFISEMVRYSKTGQLPHVLHFDDMSDII